MTIKSAPALVPKLRFSGFKGAWGVKKISDFFKADEPQKKATFFDNQKIITVKLHTLGVVKNERTKTLTGRTNYFIRKKGQFIFSKIDFLNGAFGIIPNELDGYLSSTDIPAFYFQEDVCSRYFYYWIAKHYRNLTIERTGTSNTLKRIAIKEFLKLPIPLPTLPEQQKIAKCLASLDDLIITQNKKLATLKTHKKSLLQQLFPTDDETVPKRRFPKFNEAWTVKPLGEVIISESSSMALNKLNFVSDGYPVYGADGIISYIDDYQQEEKYISIVKDGAGVGRLKLCESKSSLLGTLIYLKSKNEYKYNLIWIYYLLNKVNFSSYVKGSGIPHIYYSDFNNEKIPLTTLPEQQKIADCLASLDNAITAQNKKLDTLKTHKKGLMQQLFP